MMYEIERFRVKLDCTFDASKPQYENQQTIFRLFFIFNVFSEGFFSGNDLAHSNSTWLYRRSVNWRTNCLFKLVR